MKQCRMDCIHIEACRRFADNNTYWNIGDCPIYKPTVDVVPKKEIANVLCDLKIAVHNKAHYNHAQEVPSYITLKVFDAVIRDYLNKLEKG